MHALYMQVSMIRAHGPIARDSVYGRCRHPKSLLYFGEERLAGGEFGIASGLIWSYILGSTMISPVPHFSASFLFSSFIFISQNSPSICVYICVPVFLKKKKKKKKDFYPSSYPSSSYKTEVIGRWGDGCWGTFFLAEGSRSR